MKTLVSTVLFALLRDKAQNPATHGVGIEAAYENFVCKMAEFCESETSVAHLLRTLCYTRLELLSLQRNEYICKAEKNVMDVCEKALEMIRCEEMIIQNKFAGQHTLLDSGKETMSRSGIMNWRGGVLKLMELICSIYYSGYVTDDLGKRPSFASVVGNFCALFGLSIDKPYDMRARLAQRKKKLSILLPELQETYEKNIVKCGIDNK